MGAIVKGYNFVLNALAVCSGIVIFVAFLMIVIDVSIRILGFSPPAFTIAITEYILLYFTILAAPWLVRQKGHVFIDAVTQFLPPAVKWFTAKIAYLLCICSASIFCYFSTQLFFDALAAGILDVRGIDMPQWSLYAPMPVGFAMVAIEFLRYLVGIDDMYATSLAEREGM
jgi:TRAP-type C4-dicarboxylate transport system permease small subunit